MSLLRISKEFYDSLENSESKAILQIYGYSSRNQFLFSVIKKLNEEYNFLNLKNFDFYPDDDKRIYHMYNGYIDGTFKDYDQVIVSFTNIRGKSGNVFFNQQVVPMITSKLENDSDFLINERIKKICLLTTHKSEIMSSSANTINNDSNIQMTVNFANTVGFEFVEVFPIINLNIDGRYRNVEEIVEHTAFLQKRHASNSQFKQVKIIDNIIYGEFEREPQGQEMKFFALKMLAIGHLNRDKKINLQKALSQTRDRTIFILNEYLEYLNTVDRQITPILEEIYEHDFNIVEVAEEIDEETKKHIEQGIPEYKIPPVTIFNAKGKKVYLTKKRCKIESMNNHRYVCGCDDEKHIYFIANATRKNYLEGHHMIPMEYQHQYWTEKKLNLDCAKNIVPLCPHCHGKIHKATSPQKLEIISYIYNKYKTDLTTIDESLTLEKFASFYNVYIY